MKIKKILLLLTLCVIALCTKTNVYATTNSNLKDGDCINFRCWTRVQTSDGSYEWKLSESEETLTDKAISGSAYIGFDSDIPNHYSLNDAQIVLSDTSNTFKPSNSFNITQLSKYNGYGSSYSITNSGNVGFIMHNWTELENKLGITHYNCKQKYINIVIYNTNYEKTKLYNYYNVNVDDEWKYSYYTKYNFDDKNITFPTVIDSTNSDNKDTYTKNGYTLEWYKDSKCKTKATTNIYSYLKYSHKDTSVQFYGKQVPINYSIDYNLNGGKIDGEECIKSYTIEDTISNLPIPVKNGYEFDGWYEMVNGKEVKVNSIKNRTGNISLAAHWIHNKVNIILHTNPNDIVKNTISISKAYTKDTTLGKDVYTSWIQSSNDTMDIILPSLSADNEKFIGWYKTPDFSGNKVSKGEDSAVTLSTTEDTHLYAKWAVANCEHKNTITKTIKEPTCIENGSIEQICTDCDESFKGISPALGHDWIEGEMTNVDKGDYLETVQTYICTRCNSTKTEVVGALDKEPAVLTCDHKHKVTKNEIKATCKEKGYSGDIYCSDCDMLLEKGHDTEKIEHTYNNGVTIIEPTTTSTGIVKYTCTICGNEKIEAIPKLNTVNNTNTVTNNVIKKYTTKVKKNKVVITIKDKLNSKAKIQICKNKKFKKGIKSYNTKKNTYIIKKLKKGKYYIRIKMQNVKWSKIKTFKIK